MRENRTHGSEGGEVNFPTPIVETTTPSFSAYGPSPTATGDTHLLHHFSASGPSPTITGGETGQKGQRQY